ncbi:MAG: peptidoglycan DD-metalloendopeptidase family protein [Nocardioidaceae bacterium]|nr:peptidoglycan DD-metalloendopeptidase family protein [Nocardioidaceae bacterium]
MWAHPQWLVAAIAVMVAVAGLAVPVAYADDHDDLKNKQKHVQSQISGVKGEIHEASAKVTRIKRKLDAANKNLASAQRRLKTVRADLSQARTTAHKLAVRLNTAQKKLEVAKAKLKSARAKVTAQRSETRDTVIQMGTSGDPDLALVTAYAEGGTMEDVLASQGAADVITGRQRQSLDRLAAAAALMEKRRTEVREARDEIATTKRAADKNVKTIAALATKAKATETSVAGLVSRTDTARRAVLRARAGDRAALARLEKREQAIKSKILALSRKQNGSYSGATGGLLAKPGPGPVTSPYGYRRHPIYGYWGLHNGTDFGTGCGASLVAGESGTVIDTYYDEVYGNRLYLAIGKVNGASITLVYNHMSGYAVREGAHVRRGQVVGYSGTTGWSTGCHLHFIVMRNGETVDPMGYL